MSFDFLTKTKHMLFIMKDFKYIVQDLKMFAITEI